MSVNCSLLEKPSVKEAVLAVGKDLKGCDKPFRFDAIRQAMGWQWFEATYAISFHRVWDQLGIDRDANCGPYRTLN